MYLFFFPIANPHASMPFVPNVESWKIQAVSAQIYLVTRYIN